jgi:hypothetical protein
MKTDELRAELRRISDEMEPFDGDLLSVHRSVRRYRVVWSVVAAAAMIALVVGALAISHRTNKPPVSSTKLVPSEKLPRVDVVVVPDNASVRKVLSDSALVSEFSPLPQINPGSNGSNTFSGTSPLLTAACALRHSNGLAVQGTPNSGDVAGALQSALGSPAQVFDISHGADVEIFMKVAATPAQVTAIRNRLNRDSNVATFEFIDHNAALAEFRVAFKDQPALLQSTKASDLPESFRVRLTDPSRAQSVQSRYQAGDGLDTIVTQSPFGIGRIIAAQAIAAPCSKP